jgi:hypothetical protein
MGRKFTIAHSCPLFVITLLFPEIFSQYFPSLTGPCRGGKYCYREITESSRLAFFYRAINIASSEKFLPVNRFHSPACSRTGDGGGSLNLSPSCPGKRDFLSAIPGAKWGRLRRVSQKPGRGGYTPDLPNRCVQPDVKSRELCLNWTTAGNPDEDSSQNRIPETHLKDRDISGDSRYDWQLHSAWR